MCKHNLECALAPSCLEAVDESWCLCFLSRLTSQKLEAAGGQLLGWTPGPEGDTLAAQTHTVTDTHTRHPRTYV